MNHDRELRTHEQRNQQSWNHDSDVYDTRHEAALSGERAMAWGLWRIPEAELNILGDTRDKDILELGCGDGRWRWRGPAPAPLAWTCPRGSSSMRAGCSKILGYPFRSSKPALNACRSPTAASTSCFAIGGR